MVGIIFQTLVNEMFDELKPQDDDQYASCIDGVCAIARDAAEFAASTINNEADALEVARLMIEED